MSKKSAINERMRSVFAAIVMPLALIVAFVIYTYILGDPENFIGGDTANEPLKGNYLGTIHKGGPIVILLIGFQIILLAYVFERFFSIGKAKGKGGVSDFVQQIKALVADGKNDEALEACDKQRGSVANVVRSGVETLKRLQSSPGDPDKMAQSLQQELEEATQLELPQLNRNMIVIGTLASISTLIGLLGTVTGMIKAFASLARVGAPDAVGLASGISQALVTTALGISTAAVAIVFYNYFTNRIDKLTFSIDESSFSIVNTFKTKG